MSTTNPATETETVPWTDAAGNPLGDDDDVFVDCSAEELAAIDEWLRNPPARYFWTTAR